MLRTHGGISMAGVPFEIKRDVGSTHPINIYFDPDLYFQVTVGDALRIANCIHYLSPLSLDIRASNCQLRLDIFSPSIFKMVDTDSRRIFRLSGNEALELSVLLFNAVGSVQSVSFTATQNSLSSGQPMNYKPCQNELLDVVFDSYGQYPLHVVVTIGGSQFSMHVQDAYVELLVRCLSVPGHNDSYIVGKGEHYKVSWLPLGNLKHIKIANRTTGFSIFLASGPAARLAVLIESKMPSRHKTTEEKSESEKSVDSIKKQTDDNLRSVFGG